MGKTYENNGIKGVMLVELLIAIAVLAVIAGAVTLNLVGFGRRQELDSDAKAIVAFLRDAQNRAITQEDNSEWGVRFNSGGIYDLFKGVYIGPVSRKPLKSSVEFYDMTLPTDIIFQKLSGVTAGGQIKIRIKGASCPSEDCKTITVNQNGTVSY